MDAVRTGRRGPAPRTRAEPGQSRGLAPCPEASTPELTCCWPLKLPTRQQRSLRPVAAMSFADDNTAAPEPSPARAPQAKGVISGINLMDREAATRRPSPAPRTDLREHVQRGSRALAGAQGAQQGAFVHDAPAGAVHHTHPLLALGEGAVVQQAWEGGERVPVATVPWRSQDGAKTPRARHRRSPPPSPPSPPPPRRPPSFPRTGPRPLRPRLSLPRCSGAGVFVPHLGRTQKHPRSS